MIALRAFAVVLGLGLVFAGCTADGAGTSGAAEDPVEIGPMDAGSDIPSDVEDAELDAEPDQMALPALVSLRQDRPAPADLLFARLGGEGLGEWVDVSGIRRDAPLLVDIDVRLDDDFPFVVELLDAEGRPLFVRTLREPIQIREFLAAAGVAEMGINLFGLFPQLGDFAVAVPRLDEAVEVRFSRRAPDGAITTLGEAALGDIPDVDPPDHPWERIYGTADPADALDIAILPDGYTAEQLGDFAEQAAAVRDGFLAIAPYSDFADRLNVYRVDVPSAESGASFDCSDEVEIAGCRDERRRTAFDSIFPLRLAQGFTEGLSDEVLLQLDQWEVARVASIVPYDAIVVLVNTEKFGAFGLWVASINGPGARTPVGVVHEFGHAWGLLADEYRNAGNICQHFEVTPDFPNLSPLVTEPGAVKWSAWLTPGVPLPTPADDPEHADSVGLFQGGGGGCDDMYRPSRSCLMRRWGEPMCVVCAEQIERRLYETFDLLGPAGVRLEAGTLRADLPSGAAVEGSWWIDGERAGAATEPLALPTPAVARDLTVRLEVWPVGSRIRSRPDSMRESVEAVVRVGR